MRRFLFLLIISILSECASSQEHTLFNVGVGYPLFPGTNKGDNPEYDYNANLGNLNLFVEKDIRLFKKVPAILLTPGVAYTYIKETFKKEGLGGGGEGKYKHKALSGYIKLLYEIDRQPDIVTDFYFGLQIGYYLQSRTRGSESSWQLNSNAEVNYHNTEIDNSGEDFFHSNYFGILAGMKPLGDKQTVIQPKIELAFYPGFATLNSYYMNSEEMKNMIQISVNIGFGKGRKNEVD